MNKLFWLKGSIRNPDGTYSTIELERIAVTEAEALSLVKQTFPTFRRSAWGVKKFLV